MVFRHDRGELTLLKNVREFLVCPVVLQVRCALCPSQAPVYVGHAPLVSCLDFYP